MFVRRKKYVCTSICWIDSSPAPMRRWIHWCEGLNRRVCPAMQTRPVSRCTLFNLLRVRPAVGQRDLDLDVLARAHRGDGLGGVERGRGAQDDGVDVVAGEDLVQVGRGVDGAVLLRDLLGLLEPPADHGRDGDTLDEGEAVEVPDAERAGPGDGDPHRQLSSWPDWPEGRTTRCPTAVLDPGTW